MVGCLHVLYELMKYFEDGQTSSTMLNYFSAVCGLSWPDGTTFLRPVQFTTRIVCFISCICLIILGPTLLSVALDYSYAS
ncbi:hypothetical protein V8C37DRAFT_382497 [Trichoderma ceciliae]